MLLERTLQEYPHGSPFIYYNVPFICMGVFTNFLDILTFIIEVNVYGILAPLFVEHSRACISHILPARHFLPFPLFFDQILVGNPVSVF